MLDAGSNQPGVLPRLSSQSPSATTTMTVSLRNQSQLTSTLLIHAHEQKRQTATVHILEPQHMYVQCRRTNMDTQEQFIKAAEISKAEWPKSFFTPLVMVQCLSSTARALAAERSASANTSTNSINNNNINSNDVNSWSITH